MRSWLALAAGWTLAGAATALSAELGLATRLVFHFHPIAIAVGAAWAYRRMNGGRPCSVHAVSFLVGLAVILSSGATSLASAGLGDPPWLAVPIGIGALLGGAWVLFRREAPTGAPSAWRP